MGKDIDQFVHPERISSQLICPICTLVLTNPVQTSTDHLFCEDELLEWMTRSNLCPVTKSVLDPASIRKPSRIILNMLAELQVYCSNKCEGCTWTGPQESLPTHMLECTFRPRSELQEEIASRDAKIEELEVKVHDLLQRNDELMEENIVMKATVEEYEQRLRIYKALISNDPAAEEEYFEGDTDESYIEEPESKQLTDLDRYKRLQPIKSLMEAKEEYAKLRKK
jgi:hypothetical protein